MSIDEESGGSLLAKLIGDLDQRPYKTVEIPGRDGKLVSLWCLTLREEEQARKAAYKWVRDPKGLAFDALDLEYDEQRAIHDSIMIEMLATALRDPDNAILPYCSDSREIRDRLSSGEIQDIFRLYLDFASERQALKDISDIEKEMDELTKLVLQGFPVATRVSRYASPALKALLLSAVDRLANGTMRSSPDTSSPCE